MIRMRRSVDRGERRRVIDRHEITRERGKHASVIHEEKFER